MYCALWLKERGSSPSCNTSIYQPAPADTHTHTHTYIYIYITQTQTQTETHTHMNKQTTPRLNQVWIYTYTYGDVLMCACACARACTRRAAPGLEMTSQTDSTLHPPPSCDKPKQACHAESHGRITLHRTEEKWGVAIASILSGQEAIRIC